LANFSISLDDSPNKTPTLEIVSPKSDAALIESTAILPAKRTAAAVATLKAVEILSLNPCSFPVKLETSDSP
jgi:hypothetical protein